MSALPCILRCSTHAVAPRALELLREMAEYWTHGTPIHPGSLVAGEVRQLLRDVDARTPNLDQPLELRRAHAPLED
jgi:hypothetical protein